MHVDLRPIRLGLINSLPCDVSHIGQRRYTPPQCVYLKCLSVSAHLSHVLNGHVTAQALKVKVLVLKHHIMSMGTME